VTEELYDCWPDINEQDKRIALDILVGWREYTQRMCDAISPDCVVQQTTALQLCNSKAGELIHIILLAAGGKYENTSENKMLVYTTVRELLTILTPNTFLPHSNIMMSGGLIAPYNPLVLHPMIKLGMKAWLWSLGTELITLKEASRVSGKSLSSLSQYVDRGKIRSFIDPAERNPQKRVRVIRSEIEALTS